MLMEGHHLSGQRHYCCEWVLNWRKLDVTIVVLFSDLNLISSLNVADNVLRLPARLAGMNPKNKDINKALEMVGIAVKGSKFPNQLSGGSSSALR